MSARKVIFCSEVRNFGQRIESNKLSANFCIWNVPWEIQVWRVVTETSEFLAVKLLCLNKSYEDWNYATTVTYRLYSFDDEMQAFEYKMRPKVVNKLNFSIFTNSLIDWDDLFDAEKLYVVDDTIRMEFEIEVANPNLLNESVLQLKEIQSHCLTKFELSIKNSNNLWAVQSPNFDILNGRYFLVVYKHEEHLDVELCQINDMEKCSQPMMLVKLISFLGDDESIVQNSQFHTKKLISWKELQKPENGFNYDNTIKLEVKIMAYAVFQDAKEFIQTASSVALASPFSFGASAAANSAATSLTLNEPSLPCIVPVSTMETTDAGFKGFGNANNTVTGGLFDRKSDALGFTSGAPVPSVSTSHVSILSASTSSASDESVLTFEKTLSNDSIAKFELSIKNANYLTVVKSPCFVIRDKSYELVVQKLEGYLNVEVKPLRSDLRIQPIMLVTLVSSNGADKSIVQYTRFQTEKLVSWKELQNPENGFNCDNVIKIEVIIIKSSIDINEIEKILQIEFSSSISLSVRRFCIEVPQISSLFISNSLVFMIHGIPWNVAICKESIYEEPYLDVYLHCHERIYASFFYAASLSVKLISFSNNMKAVELHCKPYVFTNSRVSYGGSLIDWNNLFDATKCLVKNDKILLEIEINFDDPKNTAKPSLIFNNSSKRFIDDEKRCKIAIENVGSLIAVKSPPFIVRNIESYLQVYRHQDHLCVVLNTFRKISLTMVIKLLPLKGEDKSVIQVQNTIAEERPWSLKGKISTIVTTWSELLKPESGFVNNNSITLDVMISENVSDANKLTSSQTSSEIKSDCPICYENMKEKGASNISCGHLFCTQCIKIVIQDSFSCPLCRKHSKSTDIRQVFLP